MSPYYQKIIEEQSHRFYSRYERKSKSFRSTLISVVGLVTIVFVLIFYPYVTFRGTRYTLEAELKELDRNVASLAARLKEHNQLIETFLDHQETTYETIEGFNLEELPGAAAEHHQKMAAIKAALRDDPDLQPWLRGKAAGEDLPPSLRRRNPDLASANDDPCFWLSNKAWTHCALAVRIERLHNEVSSRFAYKRISHLRNELFVPLYKSLTTLHGEFSAWLLGTAPSWGADGVEAKESLRDHYSSFRNAYLDQIENHGRVIHQMRDDTSAELHGLEGQRKDTDEELKSVISRLEEMKNLRDIQTPFGQLPVGLNDLVLLFPVLLAAGFVLMASLFSETLQLRQAYHQMCRFLDPEEEILDSNHVALVAPVWIDPLQPKPHQAYRSAILALPAVIFVAAIILLLVNRLLWGAFMEEARLGQIIYAALYVASGLSIVKGVMHVYRALYVEDCTPMISVRFRKK